MTEEKWVDVGATAVANAMVVSVYLFAAYVLSQLTHLEFWQSLITVRLICEAACQIKTDPKIK